MKQQVFQGCASGRNDGAVAFQGIGALIGGEASIISLTFAQFTIPSPGAR